MGGERRSQRGLRFARTAPHGEEECFRRLLHLQEHGTGPDVPDQRAEALRAGSQPPHSGASDEPLRPLLLLRPRSDPRADCHPRGVVLSVPCHALPHGHSFIEQELKRNNVGFRKDDNAFLAVDDVAALQAAADRLSPPIIRKQLDYWTLILGPKFSKKERSQMSLSRFYSITQIEYCGNFIFKRHFRSTRSSSGVARSVCGV